MLLHFSSNAIIPNLKMPIKRKNKQGKIKPKNNNYKKYKIIDLNPSHKYLSKRTTNDENDV
jgi:hypothetical protein